MTRLRPAKSLTAAAVTLVALTLAGCGEDETLANETPALCADVDALQASVTAVTTVELDQGALAELQDKLTEVQTDLSQVKDAAEDEYASEIDAVEQASGSIRTTVEAALNSPSSQSVDDVGAAVRTLGTSLSALEEALRSTC